MKDFKNKIAFVVGGSRGIGLSVAKLLAHNGANVVIFARDNNDLRLACEEIEKKKISEDQDISFRKLDITDRDMVEEVLNDAVQKFCAPDLLINCAGRAIPHDFEDIPYSQFDDTMKLNLYGTWNAISSILPFMKEKGGHIVNVSSLAGIIGVYGYSDYCASKFALIGLSESLRSEFKQYGIRVSVLCPPDTDTPGFHKENLTKSDIVKEISQTAKLLTPDFVAEELLKGIKKNKQIIVPGFDSKIIHFIKRHLPFVVDFLISIAISRAQKSNKENSDQFTRKNDVENKNLTVPQK